MSRRTGVPHGCQHLLNRRFKEQPLLGDLLTVYENGKLASVPVHHLGLHAWFTFQGGRQTGGVFDEPASDRADADHNFLHGTISLVGSRRTIRKWIIWTIV